MYTNRFSFADRDMFTHYAAIGVGHNAVHLRHEHGLVDNQSATDNEEDNNNQIEDPPLSHVFQNDRNGDEEDEDEDEDERDEDVDSDSSVSDGYDKSDVEACF